MPRNNEEFRMRDEDEQILTEETDDDLARETIEKASKESLGIENIEEFKKWLGREKFIENCSIQRYIQMIRVIQKATTLESTEEYLIDVEKKQSIQSFSGNSKQ